MERLLPSSLSPSPAIPRLCRLAMSGASAMMQRSVLRNLEKHRKFHPKCPFDAVFSDNSDGPLEHIPGARYPKIPNMKGFPDVLHKQVVAGLGHVPTVCWNFLRCLFGRKFHIPKFLNLGHQEFLRTRSFSMIHCLGFLLCEYREPFKMHLLHFSSNSK